jgi:hypothetical protein
VQHHSAERPVQDLDDVAVAGRAALVLLGVVAQVLLREGLERDVGLPTDAMPALEDPAPFLGLDVFRLALVGRLGRSASGDRTAAWSRSRTGLDRRLPRTAGPSSNSVS